MNAIVTGGSRGIGAAAVRLLCENGWRTAFSYLDSEEQAAALERELGGAAKAFRCDAASWEQTDKFIALAAEHFGEPELLVCSAGRAHFGLFQDMTRHEWDSVLGIDLSAAAGACRAAIGHMLKNKRGSIVLISSMWGQVGASCEAAYSAAKAGLIGLGKALAKELAPSGIRVNVVCPGVIDTDMNRSLGSPVLRQLEQEIPLGRLGTAREVAQSILFLANSEYITGQVICPNGGLVI